MQKNLFVFRQTIPVIELIENSIKIFLGPSGKKALICKQQGELKHISNSVSLLNSMVLPNSSENLICKLFLHALGKSTQVSGNGSTTAILLACELLKTTMKYVTSGYNPIIISNGFAKSNHFFIQKIFNLSVSICTKEQIKKVFQTAFHKKMRPELCEFLYQSSAYLCRESLITIEENASTESAFDIIQGIEIEQGFSSCYLSNTLSFSEVTYENPFVLIATSPIITVSQIQQILDYIQLQNRSLVIITENINANVASFILLNTIKKTTKVAVIKYSTIKFLKAGVLEDLSLLSHSSLSFSENNLVKCWTIADLGQVSKVIIKKEKSIFFLSKFSKILISRRINELNRELLLCKTEYEKSFLKTRIGRLGGNIIRIKVGQISNHEIENERQLLENAICTLESSFEEGVVPGGGVIYLHLKEELFHWSLFNLVGDELASVHIFNDAFLKLVTTLFLNSRAQNVFLLIQKMQNLGYPWGYHLAEKKFINTLFSKSFGLFDSAKSVRISLLNSISLVLSVLTSE